eukprot:1950785-Pyramimonas_sp.AAC.1
MGPRGPLGHKRCPGGTCRQAGSFLDVPNCRPAPQGGAIRMRGPWAPTPKLLERGAANGSGEARTEVARMQ